MSRHELLDTMCQGTVFRMRWTVFCLWVQSVFKCSALKIVVWLGMGRLHGAVFGTLHAIARRIVDCSDCPGQSFDSQLGLYV